MIHSCSCCSYYRVQDHWPLHYGTHLLEAASSSLVVAEMENRKGAVKASCIVIRIVIKKGPHCPWMTYRISCYCAPSNTFICSECDLMCALYHESHMAGTYMQGRIMCTHGSVFTMNEVLLQKRRGNGFVFLICMQINWKPLFDYCSIN